MFSGKSQYERDALAQIRKDASNPYARLHSIAEDAKFVDRIRSHYSTYPTIANLRCGTWYTNFAESDAVFSHFKSADGHYNGWTFNLRRPNLHIIPHILKSNGALVVDSTRAGKRMPDSFSKTVPIWCCVVNRAAKLRFSSIANRSDWDANLYCPPQCVSKQEKHEIEKRVSIWAKELASSSYELPLLSRPLRPVWLGPSSSILPNFGDDTPFLPLICLTASRQVGNGLERRSAGFSYVQGAGDDHENWSNGLTPGVFWMNREELLSSSEEDFPGVLNRIVSESAMHLESLLEAHPISISKVNGLVQVAKAGIGWTEMTEPLDTSNTDMAYIVLGEMTRADAEGEKLGRILQAESEPKKILLLNVIPEKKGGDHSLKGSFRRCMDFIELHLWHGRNICIACNTGTDLSVGIAIAALQTFFDDTGALDMNRKTTIETSASKDSLRLRLQWIIASKSDANPSRSTLKRLNEFFMSHRGT